MTSQQDSPEPNLPDLPLPDPVLRLRGLHHELVQTQAPVRNAKFGGSNPNSAPPENYGYIIDVAHMELPRGGFVAILGPSGCGKTTLLTILGLARKPWRMTPGSAADEFSFFEYAGNGAAPQHHALMDTWDGRGNSRSIEELRRRFLGFALQSGELLTNLRVIENVEMPLRLNGWPADEARRRVKEVLLMLGTEPGQRATAGGDVAPSEQTSKLWERRRHLPSQLSGGEYQRVALARALAHRPRILFLDEPTNNLDPKTAARALQALKDIQQREGVTVVMVTHDIKLAHEFAGFIIRMDSPAAGRGTVVHHARKDAHGGWWETDASWRPTGPAQVPAPVPEVQADEAASEDSSAPPRDESRADARPRSEPKWLKWAVLGAPLALGIGVAGRLLRRK